MLLFLCRMFKTSCTSVQIWNKLLSIEKAMEAGDIKGGEKKPKVQTTSSAKGAKRGEGKGGKGKDKGKDVGGAEKAIVKSSAASKGKGKGKGKAATNIMIDNATKTMQRMMGSVSLPTTSTPDAVLHSSSALNHGFFKVWCTCADDIKCMLLDLLVSKNDRHTIEEFKTRCKEERIFAQMKTAVLSLLPEFKTFTHLEKRYPDHTEIGKFVSSDYSLVFFLYFRILTTIIVFFSSLQASSSPRSEGCLESTPSSCSV
jgi:hypothetical protein